jgi:cyclopropane fatty-acyl-phospholipid synthase-like methyltransferase
MMTLYAAKFGDVSHVVGVDIFPLATATAMQYANYTNLTGKVSFQTFNFVQDVIPLENESFDGVISFHTLEHIYPEDIDIFIRHIYDILVDGGKAFISIPYDHWIGSPEHVSYFTVQSLSEAFYKGGFRTLCAWICGDSGGQTGILAILNGLFEKREKLNEGES